MSISLLKFPGLLPWKLVLEGNSRDPPPPSITRRWVQLAEGTDPAGQGVRSLFLSFSHETLLSIEFGKGTGESKREIGCVWKTGRVAWVFNAPIKSKVQHSLLGKPRAFDYFLCSIAEWGICGKAEGLPGVRSLTFTRWGGEGLAFEWFLFFRRRDGRV